MKSRGIHRLALLTAFATLALIGVGGLVTSRGVGLSVPDWPNTYGYNMFFFPFSKWVGGIFYEHSHRLVAALVGLLTSALAMWLWIDETRSKTRHYGVAAMAAVLMLMCLRQMPVYYGLAGLALVMIGVGLYLAFREPGSLRWLGVATFAAVILQGVLGGLRVVWLKDQIGIFHAALAQMFFVLVCAITLMTSRWWNLKSEGSLKFEGSPLTPALSRGERERHHQPLGEFEALRPQFDSNSVPGSVRFGGWRKLFIATSALILFQLVLGAAMRHQHAGLAIPDFPLAYGMPWPAMDAVSVARYNQQRIEVSDANPITAFQIGLQMVHRLAALTILVAVAFCARTARRETGARSRLSRGAMVWLGLVCAQALLGAATIWSGKAADIATAHVAGGALSLALGAMLSLIGSREMTPASTQEPLIALPGSTSREMNPVSQPLTAPQFGTL